MKQIRFPKAGGQIRLDPGETYYTTNNKGLEIIIRNILPPITCDEKIAGISRTRFISLD